MRCRLPRGLAVPRPDPWCRIHGEPHLPVGESGRSRWQAETPREWKDQRNLRRRDSCRDPASQSQCLRNPLSFMGPTTHFRGVRLHRPAPCPPAVVAGAGAGLVRLKSVGPFHARTIFFFLKRRPNEGNEASFLSRVSPSVWAASVSPRKGQGCGWVLPSSCLHGILLRHADLPLIIDH